MLKSLTGLVRVLVFLDPDFLCAISMYIDPKLGVNKNVSG